MRLIIVSGRSGSGKSTALNVLEDNGFYCIDNLPAGLLPELAERALIHTELAQPLVAVSIDARNLPSHLERFPQLLEEVRAKHIHCDVLYLDADEETLLKRFSETRRRHPLSSPHRSLAEAIEDETKLLGPIIDLADLKINTTSLNLYQLRDAIKLRLLNQPEPGTAFLVESFGFKRGMPVDADLVFDVRCLPNPYWNCVNSRGWISPWPITWPRNRMWRRCSRTSPATCSNGYRVLPQATAPMSPLPSAAPAGTTAPST